MKELKETCKMCGGILEYKHDDSQELGCKQTHHVYQCRTCKYPKYVNIHQRDKSRLLKTSSGGMSPNGLEQRSRKFEDRGRFATVLKTKCRTTQGGVLE